MVVLVDAVVGAADRAFRHAVLVAREGLRVLGVSRRRSMNWWLMKYRLREQFAIWKRFHPPKTPPDPKDRCSWCGHDFEHHWVTHRDGCDGPEGIEFEGCFDQCMCKGWVSEKWINQKLDEALQILRGKHAATNEAAKGGLTLIEDMDVRGNLSIVEQGKLTLKK